MLELRHRLDRLHAYAVVDRLVNDALHRRPPAEWPDLLWARRACYEALKISECLSREPDYRLVLARSGWGGLLERLKKEVKH